MFLEAPAGIEPAMAVLQTAALPLGDGAVFYIIVYEASSYKKFSFEENY